MGKSTEMKDIDIDRIFKRGFNCAETTIHAYNELCDLKLSEDDMKMFAGFGGGMCSYRTCGALCAGIGVLSRIMVKDSARATEGFAQAVKEYVDRFEDTLGSTQCEKLIPIYFSGGAVRPDGTLNHCVVEQNMELLDEVLRRTGIFDNY